MGGKLTVVNDINANIIHAYVFTSGQGFCLEKISSPSDGGKFEIVFSKSLGNGSWYDVFVRIDSEGSMQAYLFKGVYLTANKSIQLSDVLTVGNYVNCTVDSEWSCDNCKELNEADINVCLHCYTNRAHGIIRNLSCIPIVGLPFSVANAVLATGRASHTGQTQDKIEAGVAIGTATMDVVLTPFLVNSLIKIPAAVAAKTGVRLTSKTLLSETGQVAARMAGKAVQDAAVLRATVVKVVDTTIADVVRRTEQEKK